MTAVVEVPEGLREQASLGPNWAAWLERLPALAAELLADGASVGTMIHCDPHYEPAPMLWNRWDELVASGNVREGVRRRFHTLIDAAGLDEDRARDWVVVRMPTSGTGSPSASRSPRLSRTEVAHWVVPRVGNTGVLPRAGLATHPYCQRDGPMPAEATGPQAREVTDLPGRTLPWK